ncbi:MAG: PQQ-binding-like beta-propeller repeat protein [bacterium]|nr:PQQ-binding-like beta-propeller repeat protein [bacterium]
MKKELFAIGFLFVFTNPANCAYLPWPMLMGNPQRTGLFVAQNGERGTMDSAWVKWKNDTFPCISSSPAIGDVDTDAIVEVVVGGEDGVLYAINGGDGQIKWSKSLGSASTYTSGPAIGDIDGDSAIEILIGDRNGILYAVKGDGSAIKWSRKVGNELSSSPVIGDVDGDTNTVEVVVNTIDSTKCFVGATGTAIWTSHTGETGGTNVYSSPAIGNVDGISGAEVIIASNDETVYALNGLTGATVWRCSTEYCGVSGTPSWLIFVPTLGDIDLDGIVEVVVHHSSSIYVINGQSGALILEKNYGVLAGIGVNEGVSIGNVANDNRLEIIMRNNGIRALDEAMGTENWNYAFPTSQTIGSIPILADVDGDSKLEVIDANHVGWFACVNGEDGTLKWELHVMNNDIHPTHGIGDIDGDGCMEIVGIGNDGPVYAIESNCPTPVEEKTTNIKTVDLNVIYQNNKPVMLLNLNQLSNVSLKIYDVAGNLKQFVYEGSLGKGSYSFTTTIPKNGIYFVRADINGKALTKKIVLVK